MFARRIPNYMCKGTHWCVVIFSCGHIGVNYIRQIRREMGKNLNPVCMCAVQETRKELKKSVCTLIMILITDLQSYSLRIAFALDFSL